MRRKKLGFISLENRPKCYSPILSLFKLISANLNPIHAILYILYTTKSRRLPIVVAAWSKGSRFFLFFFYLRDYGTGRDDTCLFYLMCVPLKILHQTINWNTNICLWHETVYTPSTCHMQITINNYNTVKTINMQITIWKSQHQSQSLCN